MSIKNIIQQENDLQEMSQQSLANYLNNPTGQYNPYLVAGELQRKEQFARRQMVEAPQETVVDELVQKTMPMGGMSRGRMPMGGMPMPRPQETMMPDAITETGISNLPAPNIGQNYAEGGIIGYDDGGEVGFLDQVRDFDYKGFLNDRIDEKGLDERILRAEKFAAGEPITEEGIDDAYSFGLGSIKSAGKKGFDYLKKKLTPTPTKPTPKKKLTKKEQDAFLNKQKTPPQTALEKANQFKDTRSPAQKIKDKAKELYRSTSSDKGPLTRAGIATLRGAGQGAGPLTRFVGKGLTKYPVETGLGAYGTYKGLDYFFGETEEEEAARLAADAAKKAAASQAELDRMEKTRLQNQAELDAEQAQRDEEARRRAYLALALGGAKTMAGQSPYALTNIGEGLGTGVAGLVELDEAAATRQSAKAIADAKMRQNLYEFNLERRLKIAEFRAELSENVEFRAAVDAQLEAIGQDRTTIDHAKLVAIEEKIIMQSYPELGPTAGATMVAGETYAEV
jgi:hypothetical protein